MIPCPNRLKTAVLFVASAVVCWSVPAFADPITAAFDVHVTNRIHPTQAGTPGDPVNYRFTLFMTFDPTAGAGRDLYQPLTFSPVPLPVPPRLNTPPHISATTAIHGYDFRPDPVENPEEVFDVWAMAHYGEQSHVPATEMSEAATYSLTLAIWNWQEHAADRPPLTGDVFPLHLSEGDNMPWNFTYVAQKYVSNHGYTHDSYFYYGRATLRDTQAPIPEPATLALVGTGLLFCGHRLRTTRRRKPGSIQ